MSTFCHVRNLFARVGQAATKYPRIVRDNVLKGTIGGFALSGAVDGITYLAETSVGCARGNYIQDHASEYGCTTTGDPCQTDVSSWWSFTTGGTEVLHVTCNDPANVDKLTQAGADYHDQQRAQKVDDYLGKPGERTGGYAFTVSFPIIGAFVGAVAGLVYGVKQAEKEMAKPLARPLLQDAVASTSPSSLHSPKNPRNLRVQIDGAPTADTRIAVKALGSP